MQSLTDLIPGLVTICEKASGHILEVYKNPDRFNVQTKADNSPVTAADMASHHEILKGLKLLAPEIPVLSEEDAPGWETRKHWSRFWSVDPLDGTKEFIAQTGEFSINIALVENSKVLLGLIYAPVSGEYWWGSGDLGAFKGQTESISANTSLPQVRVITSRRFHVSGEWFTNLEAKDYELINHPCGSALKFCRIAEGLADVYPRIGPTSEWDTAAGQGIIEGAGGALLNSESKPLSYNKENLLNPSFYAASSTELVEIMVGLNSPKA